MITNRFNPLLVLALAAVASACTVSDTQPPPLSGPSEMSLSLTISANPDVLPLDGASQSQITIEARDSNGQPAANVPLRVEIVADGQSVDFGTISARTLVTNSQGRATFTYTAPLSITGEIPNLSLSITPTGTDASTHVRRTIAIRLVPPGVIANGPTPRFTFVPTNPGAFTDVRFDGSTSTGGLGAAITAYVWDFGDGTSGTGVTPTHQYAAAGTYLVRLTVTDTSGLSTQSASQPLTVGAGATPTAEFVYSPSAPKSGDSIFFNGTLSTAGAGHRIVRYDWDFGSGSRRSGATVSKVYDTPGNYTVVLTVTDEVGQTARRAQSVTVAALADATASFTFSPTDPGPGDSVNFNGSASRASEGATITRYDWNFGDGATASGTVATTAHSYAVAKSYIITLKVTDSAGKTALATQSLTVE